MNSTTTTTFNPRLLTFATFVALASSSSLICSAADSTKPLQATVKYGDLNVSSTQGATALYNRIRAAAENVCHPLDGRNLSFKTLAARCIHDAIATAVKDVNQPALFAVYNAKNDVFKPIVLASSQTR